MIGVSFPKSVSKVRINVWDGSCKTHFWTPRKWWRLCRSKECKLMRKCRSEELRIVITGTVLESYTLRQTLRLF